MNPKYEPHLTEILDKAHNLGAYLTLVTRVTICLFIALKKNLDFSHAILITCKDIMFINMGNQMEQMLLRQIYFLPGVLKREWKKKDEIERIASKMLRSLLRDVYCINSFYKRKFDGLPITDIKTLDDLKILPFTTKDELREAFPSNLSRGYTIDTCVHESTSGSTGDVLNIYHDPAAYDYYESMKFREYRGYNYSLKDKIAYTRFDPTQKEVYEYFGLFRRYYIPVHYSAQEQLNLIVKYNPDVLSVYPSSLYEIAKLVEEYHVQVHPKFIISHSELLTEHTRNYIQSVFDCSIYNEYSSFEVHNIATECTHGGMHIHLDSNVVEIIKDGNPASPGEVGEIVVTNLSNRAMPFIRYRTGDFGALEEEGCTCGRGLPLLKVIEGRKDEYITLPSGKKVSPRVFDPLDRIFHEHVSRFQIVQKERGRFIIKVVKREQYTTETANLLVQEAKKCVPEPVDVEVMEVDDIKRTGRGKFRAVISEVTS